MFFLGVWGWSLMEKRLTCRTMVSPHNRSSITSVSVSETIYRVHLVGLFILLEAYSLPTYISWSSVPKAKPKTHRWWERTWSCVHSWLHAAWFIAYHIRCKCPVPQLFAFHKWPGTSLSVGTWTTTVFLGWLVAWPACHMMQWPRKLRLVSQLVALSHVHGIHPSLSIPLVPIHPPGVCHDTFFPSNLLSAP